MIKVFTHDDFDGAGCAIIAKYYFGESVEIEHCSHHEINEIFPLC